MQKKDSTVLKLTIDQQFSINNCAIVQATQYSEELNSITSYFIGTRFFCRNLSEADDYKCKVKQLQFQKTILNFEIAHISSDQREKSFTIDKGKITLTQMQSVKKQLCYICQKLKKLEYKQEIFSTQNHTQNYSSQTTKHTSTNTVCTCSLFQSQKESLFKKAQRTAKYLRVSNFIEIPTIPNLIRHISDHPLELIVGLQMLYELKLILLGDYKKRFSLCSFESKKSSRIKIQISKCEEELECAILSLFQYFDDQKEQMIRRQVQMIHSDEQFDPSAIDDLLKIISQHEDHFDKQKIMNCDEMDQIKKDLIKLLAIFDLYRVSSLNNPRPLTRQMMLNQADLDRNIETGLGGIQELIYTLFLSMLGLQESEKKISQCSQERIPQNLVYFLEETCLNAGKVHQSDQELYRMIRMNE